MLRFVSFCWLLKWKFSDDNKYLKYLWWWHFNLVLLRKKPKATNSVYNWSGNRIFFCPRYKVICKFSFLLVFFLAEISFLTGHKSTYSNMFLIFLFSLPHLLHTLIPLFPHSCPQMSRLFPRTWHKPQLFSHLGTKKQ